MEATLGIMIPIIGIIGIFITIIYLRRYENFERMSMIERGTDPKLFSNARNASLPLRLSLLMIGAGIGLLLGYLLDSVTDMDEVAYFSMLFIAGGIGLGMSYLIEEKKAKQRAGK